MACGEMNSATASGAAGRTGNRAADPPLADDPGQRGMRGLRMNTLGWFDLTLTCTTRAITLSQYSPTIIGAVLNVLHH